MGVSRKRFQAAGSKRTGEPDVGRGWPVFEEYAETHTDDDILLDAVIEPVRWSRAPGGSPGVAGGMSPANWQDAEKRSVRRYVAPITQHKDLFLKFARLFGSSPVPAQEALEVVREWVSEYGVLGLAGVDDGTNAGRRESVRGFWRASTDAATILDLYEAAIPEKPDRRRLGEVLARWEPQVDWSGFSAGEQREYALRRVADKVGQTVKDECYPQLWRMENKARNSTQWFAYDFGFHSLLGAMYLQMMLLLTDANNVRVCQRHGCHRIIPPYTKSGKKTKSDKKTCSDACRKWVSENR